MCIEKMEVYCSCQRHQKSSKSEGFCCSVWHWVKQNVWITAVLFLFLFVGAIRNIWLVMFCVNDTMESGK